MMRSVSRYVRLAHFTVNLERVTFISRRPDGDSIVYCGKDHWFAASKEETDRIERHLDLADAER